MLTDIKYVFNNKLPLDSIVTHRTRSCKAELTSFTFGKKLI